MFTHTRQVVPADLCPPPCYFRLYPLGQCPPPCRPCLLRTAVTTLRPGQCGARVGYSSTYRRAGRPLRWLRKVSCQHRRFRQGRGVVDPGHPCRAAIAPLRGKRSMNTGAPLAVCCRYVFHLSHTGKNSPDNTETMVTKWATYGNYVYCFCAITKYFS